MLYRAHLQLFLAILLTAGAVLAQSVDQKPVSKSEVFEALEASRTSEELVKKANADLVAAIKARGLDFILTPEEEWQLEMRDASDELLTAIRDAIDPQEREARINADRQQRLYTQFASNYNAADLASRSAALTAAREFVDLYANDPNVGEIVTFMQRSLPRLQQSVTMMEQREAAMERARAQAIERQQRTQQDRDERDRRRQIAAEAAAGREESRRRDNARENRNSVTEAVPPPPRQPSDPVVRTPRIPVIRRP